MIFHLFAIVLGLLASSPQSADLSQQETAPATPFVERNEKEFDFYPGGKLQIGLGLAGNVKIVGWQRSSIRLEAERIIYRLTEAPAKELAKQHPLQVRWTQTTATVKASGPAAAADMELNLLVYVPKDKTDVTVNMLKGDLFVSALNGWVEATLEDGNIEVDSISGYFSGITKNGTIDAGLSGRRWDGHGFTAVTQNGGVNLRLPEKYSAALQLETRDGGITIDYPKQLVDGEEIPLSATAKKKARSLTASVGDGGSPIRVLTFSGDIQLITAER
jgi:DUF4097 and DUF4098 domain-containing protein YvlB